MNKNKFMKIMAAAFCALFAVIMTSCDDDDDNGIHCNPGKVEVEVGKTQTVTLSNGTEAYTVKSSDETIAKATVEKSTMTVSGVKEGKCTIMVTDSKKLTAAVNITVKAAGLTFSKTSIEVAKDKEATITVSDGTAPYTATSKDTKVATVSVKDNTVVVKGVKAGKTTVTVTDKNKKTGTVAITVK